VQATASSPAEQTRTSIEGGIEWYAWEGVPGCQCARCGSSAEFLSCASCGGEGYSHHDCGEDTCCCLHPEDNVVCSACCGEGGSWHCFSTPGFCEGHPLPGREQIQSTALRAEAWVDA
jgi:hypothetical protein